MNLGKGNKKERAFPLILTLLALAAFAFAAPRPAHAAPAICVNNSSGTVRIVPSCTVGTNLSPCHNNETCIGSLNGQPFATNESWESCDESLCIDTPNPDGTGGWGHNVTSLTVGVNATLTVTALNPGECDSGTITLTWRQTDFSFVGHGDTSATCTDPFDLGSVVTCSYTDFGHSAKSDSFTFTPQNPTNTALVTATVDACGQQASETFPVAITK